MEKLTKLEAFIRQLDNVYPPNLNPEIQRRRTG